jgi:hypothetical protein
LSPVNIAAVMGEYPTTPRTKNPPPSQSRWLSPSARGWRRSNYRAARSIDRLKLDSSNSFRRFIAQIAPQARPRLRTAINRRQDFQRLGRDQNPRVAAATTGV